MSAEDPAGDHQPHGSEQRNPPQEHDANAELRFGRKTVIHHHYARAPKANRPRRINVLGWFTAVFAAIAAGIYAYQASIFQNQLNVARQQFSLAEKTSVAQLRAYVFATDAKILNFASTTAPAAHMDFKIAAKHRQLSR